MKSNVVMGDIRLADLGTFDLNLLRIFDALMRERSVTRAGDRLALSQPAVSGALARLRLVMDDPLFVRIGNEMVPTPRAETIAPAVRDILSNAEGVLQSEDRFDPASAEQIFTLRGADFFSMRLMPAFFRTISTEAPGIRLRFLDSGYGDLVQLLKDGTVDLALERPLDLPSWISRALVFPSPFVVIASRNNPMVRATALADGDTLPLDLFCDLPHAIRSADGTMSGVVDDALAATGRRRRVTLALPHFQAVALAVAEGQLVAVVPQQLATDVAEEMNLAVFSAPFPVPVPEVQMYWNSRHDRNAQQEWLRDRVRECVWRLWPE